MKNKYRTALILLFLAFTLVFAPAVLADTSYVVQPGDTLYKIAVNHGVTMQAIAQANGILNYDHIEAGQTLTIPGGSAAPAPATAPAASAGSYVVKPGDTLFRIALNHGLQTAVLAQANGITNVNHIEAGQTLTIPAAGSAAAPTSPQPPAPTSPQSPVSSPHPSRWIDVNLSTQTLTAYEGDIPVMTTAVSTGTYLYPTVTGQFSIYLRHQSQDMNGYLLGYDYYLPGVPYVQYFYRGFALHGTYWHNNFGTPMSHGCVNLPTDKAQWLYNWATYGTLVNVHY